MSCEQAIDKHGGCRCGCSRLLLMSEVSSLKLRVLCEKIHNGPSAPLNSGFAPPAGDATHLVDELGVRESLKFLCLVT